MNILFLDCETQWALNLKKFGAARCASDPSAKINCITWAMNDGPINLLDYHAMNTDGSQEAEARLFLEAWFAADHVVAHNAEFEILVFKYILKKEKALSRWIDTMAMCAYYGYPRGLDDAAQALQCTTLKDIGGKAVMLKLATGDWTPETAPDDFRRLYSYCGIDTEVMRQIFYKLPALPEMVREQWELNCEVNLRGVPIDVEMIRNAVNLKSILANQINDELSALTFGFVTAVTQTDKIKDWMALAGFPMPDCTADTVTKMIHQANLPPREQRILEIRQEAGLTSLAKYQKMLDYAVDNRLYSMHDFYGAHTGRPTGNGPQVLNFPRHEDPIFWAEVIANQPSYVQQCSRPAEKLKAGLRGAICAS